jgi:hypothetical protein
VIELSNNKGLAIAPLKHKIMKKELTEAEVAFIRRALKHFQNWLGSGEEPVLDNLVSNF